ncbi:ethanolamine utilization microcompartment protein EutL [Fictibacillus fluitans]|uniref:Ethanolamine utilization microcompartment protein EutL n=1 Tax=Fictibacillus fluitans TaxID=3058422 RepID=A0ABT8I0S3_9BACL|nr:ethanolamine utilization microcompartment protein EutL [Fictibacillus sp. NE201]MDN4526634.1 ethanolamine utilization microcompartment protein EutL [Fictibacillus sp. NE201]
MEQQKLKAEILAIRMIPNADDSFCKSLQLRHHQKSLGMLTTTIDDIGYTALDEATKQADVEVVYARSFYGGANHSSGPLSGEFIGIIAGSSPDEVKSGIDAARNTIEFGASFESLNADGTHAFFAHVIPRTGSYLSKLAEIQQGDPLAYLIAPPLESVYGIDAALKAADVQLVKFFGPPSETNFGGGLLTGSESACRAAADAFRESVIRIAEDPLAY